MARASGSATERVKSARVPAKAQLTTGRSGQRTWPPSVVTPSSRTGSSIVQSARVSGGATGEKRTPERASCTWQADVVAAAGGLIVAAEADGGPGWTMGAEGGTAPGRLCGNGARVGGPCPSAAVPVPTAAAMTIIRTDGLCGTPIEGVDLRRSAGGQRVRGGGDRCEDQQMQTVEQTVHECASSFGIAARSSCRQRRASDAVPPRPPTRTHEDGGLAGRRRHVGVVAARLWSLVAWRQCAWYRA